MGSLLKQAMRFGAVGVINTSVDMLVFYAVYEHAWRSILVANTLGWLVSVQCSYLLHSRFTFRDHARELRLGEYVKFIASALVVLVVGTVSVYAAAMAMPVYWAKLLAIGIAVLTNFCLLKFGVFTVAGRPASA